MEEVTISSKGQIVIPKYLRDALGIKTGSKLLIRLEGKRLVLLQRPENPVEALENFGKEIELKGIRREIKGE